MTSWYGKSTSTTVPPAASTAAMAFSVMASAPGEPVPPPEPDTDPGAIERVGVQGAAIPAFHVVGDPGSRRVPAVEAVEDTQGQGGIDRVPRHRAGRVLFGT